MNVQFQTLPWGRTWKLFGLLLYNGATSKFESINLQAVHEWDCLEASVTYTENPFAFRSDRQVFFTLRIKGLPLLQKLRAWTRRPSQVGRRPGRIQIRFTGKRLLFSTSFCAFHVG